MPRRNNRGRRARRPSARSTPDVDPTTDQLARDLVRRGLASRKILGVVADRHSGGTQISERAAGDEWDAS